MTVHMVTAGLSSTDSYARLSGQIVVRQLGQAGLGPNQASKSKQTGPGHGGSKLFASDSEGKSVKGALLPGQKGCVEECHAFRTSSAAGKRSQISITYIFMKQTVRMESRPEPATLSTTSSVPLSVLRLTRCRGHPSPSNLPANASSHKYKNPNDDGQPGPEFELATVSFLQTVSGPVRRPA